MNVPLHLEFAAQMQRAVTLRVLFPVPASPPSWGTLPMFLVGNPVRGSPVVIMLSAGTFKKNAAFFSDEIEAVNRSYRN